MLQQCEHIEGKFLCEVFGISNMRVKIKYFKAFKLN